MREIVEQVRVYKRSERLFDVERLMASHRWLRKRKEGEERKDVEGRRNGARARTVPLRLLAALFKTRGPY